MNEENNGLADQCIMPAHTQTDTSHTAVENFISFASIHFIVFLVNTRAMQNRKNSSSSNTAPKMHFVIKSMLGCIVCIFQTCFMQIADTIQMPLANVDLTTINHPNSTVFDCLVRSHTHEELGAHCQPFKPVFNPSSSYVHLM